MFSKLGYISKFGIFITYFIVVSAQTENIHEDIKTDLQSISSIENDVIMDINGTIITFPNMIIPNDDFKCDDFTLKLYRAWTMVYEFDADDIKKLMCRCKGLCTFQTVAPDVLQLLKHRRLDVLSDLNKDNFIIVVTTFAAIFIVGTIGNIVTIIGLSTWMKQRSPTYGFVISLCCSDLLMLVLCMPIKATEYFKLSNIFNEFTCKLSYYARDITFISTVLTHTIISFERFYAICHPMQVKYRCTRRRARKLVLMTWFLSLCLALPTPFMMKHYYDERRLTIECLPQSKSLSLVVAYFIYMLGILFVIPCLVMMVTYSTSSSVLWKSTKVAKNLDETQGISDTRKGHKVSSSITQRKRVVALLIAAVILFITSWAPHLLFQLLEVTGHIHIFINVNYAKNLIVFGAGLTYLGSAINPYLFMAMSSQFCEQSTCRKICCRRSYQSSDRSKDIESDKSTRDASSSVTRPQTQESRIRRVL